MGQAPLTCTIAADNVLWIFSARKGQWPFLILLPVSLLPWSSQISHWLFSAGSSAYVRNFFYIWCELRLISSVTWKLPLKNWRNWQCSALFFRAVKGFIMHSVHGSPMKCKIFSSKDRLSVRSSLVHACVLASKCNCLDHLGKSNGFDWPPMGYHLKAPEPIALNKYLKWDVCRALSLSTEAQAGPRRGSKVMGCSCKEVHRDFWGCTGQGWAALPNTSHTSVV